MSTAFKLIFGVDVMDWLRSCGLYILLAISCAVTYLWLYYNREKLNAKWYALLIISVLHIAKLYAKSPVGRV